MRTVSMEQLARVASAHAWMQRLVLFFLFLIATVGLSTAYGNPTPVQPLLALLGFFFLAGGVWMLGCVYACAKGSGRSGLAWFLLVFIFKLPIFLLCYYTRNWLRGQGVTIGSLGLTYRLPHPDAVEEEEIGFSRF